MTIYQKVITAYEMLRSAISSRMSKYDVASDFNELSTYDEGRLVIYQDEIFICKKQHTGAWDANDFQRTTFGEAILYNVGKTEDSIMEKISDEFNDITPYLAGQIVRRDGKIYRCTTAHTGEWDEGDFSETTVSEVMNQMISELEQTAKKSELGYSGKRYELQGFEEIHVKDMEVAVLKVMSGTETVDGYFSQIVLPNTEPASNDGSFHSCKCTVVIDASNMYPNVPLKIDIVSADENCDVYWEESPGEVESSYITILDLTFIHSTEYFKMWSCVRSRVKYIDIGE